MSGEQVDLWNAPSLEDPDHVNPQSPKLHPACPHTQECEVLILMPLSNGPLPFEQHLPAEVYNPAFLCMCRQLTVDYLPD